MQLKNSSHTYGLISVLFHWITAIGVIGLFALGLWMDDLDYYDAWYKAAPHLHKSFGVILFVVIVARLVWKIATPQPEHISGQKTWERVLAKGVHVILYAMVLLMLPTGYLITTAKGKGLDVFNWFQLPSIVSGIDGLESYAHEIHEFIAFSIIFLVVLHALAALKHHFVDRDKTLKRIFGL